jgi:hypothetical protein
MRQFFILVVFGLMVLALNACHCKTCHVGGPGDCCTPCPCPLKPLTPPLPKSRCELPRWPDRPVKCVTTQVCRKCCHCEPATTCEGYQYHIEVCEITYKSLYTDGSSKIWTEVSRNPVVKSPTNEKWNTHWKHRQPLRHSIVGDRRDTDGSDLQSRVQNMEKHVAESVCEIANKGNSESQKASQE